MLSTASPEEKLPGLPMLSAVAGNVPGAGSQRTRPVTTYVPAELPPAVTIVQVPRPVTASDFPPRPAEATKVPVPVNVIVSPMLSCADAWPPGFTVGPAVRWMMSQRTRSAFSLSLSFSFPCTLPTPRVVAINAINDTTAIPEIHLGLTRAFISLSFLWLRVRNFGGSRNTERRIKLHQVKRIGKDEAVTRLQKCMSVHGLAVKSLERRILAHRS